MSDNEDFNIVDVVFGKPPAAHEGHGHHPKIPTDKAFYERTVENLSAPWSYPGIVAADTLRELYPKHSLVLSRDLSFLKLPGVARETLQDMPLTTNLIYNALPKREAIPGLLVDQIELGGFKLSWNDNDFIVYILTLPVGMMGYRTQAYILHQGAEDQSRLLLLASGAWSNELHEEIWVYDQSYWNKDHALWSEIQKANWKDVILKDEFKKSVQKDVYGFFASEKIYKDLGIPWKRGLIMYGPPGNGKTISIKAIMKSCDEKGFTPLYVKSFHHWAGDERGMLEVFDKARETSPCVLILEDLDSLITDQNRSFFLNQVDGLHNNDGLLLIGTTNHFDRLDPGLSNRPSRFDRKYNFDDPDEESRKLYVLYWKKKLENNHDIDFSDELVDDIAKRTERFSFAYLKEAFVSSLVTLAGWDSDEKKPSFESLIKQEIDKLSKQLDKPDEVASQTEGPPDVNQPPLRPPRPDSATERDLLAVFDALSLTEGGTRRAYTGHPGSQPRDGEQSTENIRTLANKLSDMADAQSFRRYTGGSGSRERGQRYGRYDEMHEPSDFIAPQRMERHWRGERHREPVPSNRYERTPRLRPGNVFDYGSSTFSWESSYRSYPTASNTLPVRFDPDATGPSGSDLA